MISDPPAALSDGKYIQCKPPVLERTSSAFLLGTQDLRVQLKLNVNHGLFVRISVWFYMFSCICISMVHSNKWSDKYWTWTQHLSLNLV